jgi:4-hydroxy-3-polyprenylbenzoate decarboxylase
MGVVIAPPVPALYAKPVSIDEMVNYTCVRLLDQLGIHLETTRWAGLGLCE